MRTTHKFSDLVVIKDPIDEVKRLPSDLIDVSRLEVPRANTRANAARKIIKRFYMQPFSAAHVVAVMKEERYDHINPESLRNGVCHLLAQMVRDKQLTVVSSGGQGGRKVYQNV